MATKTDVIFSDTLQGIDRAVEEIFRHFGGVKALLKESGDVYLKVNGVDHKPYAYTDPDVLRAVITHLKREGARRIYVIENCTQGNITRLVFKVTGMARVCRQTGAIPVYLDETDAVPVYLEGLETFIDISAFVHERLIENADKNLYISLPKLKTHSMSQVTLWEKISIRKRWPPSGLRCMWREAARFPITVPSSCGVSAKSRSPFPTAATTLRKRCMPSSA